MGKVFNSNILYRIQEQYADTNQANVVFYKSEYVGFY